MSIKSLKTRTGKSSRYKQGYFDTTKSSKYMSTEPCIYRSSYEYKLILWFERSSSIVKWSSEPFAVQYACLETGKQRNYYVDFYAITSNGEMWLVEVKPKKEVDQAIAFGKTFKKLTDSIAKKRYVNSNKTAAKNYSKWVSAKAFSEANGKLFKIVTEVFLKM